jgi:hypothetical protein
MLVEGIELGVIRKINVNSWNFQKDASIQKLKTSTIPPSVFTQESGYSSRVGLKIRLWAYRASAYISGIKTVLAQ